uniref:Uncharacterized protein n=1 Tax=Euplotes harpa TaxID=151035 RepID=A0A7S3N4J0_9SPIT|mmetsp:Transcript_10398/g.11647  ORF Transcript_10398/g.11647 Transcript_10398/m.11647 type:complete len:116 (+) Transcript_10398:134-481(+)
MQIQDYENQIDSLRYDHKKNKNVYDQYESGVDLSSNEDDEQAREHQRNKDYVEVKVKGLEEEIKKLKAMQVVEQTNINEIQSKINQINMEKNLRSTNRVKKELNRHEKYMTPNKV